MAFLCKALGAALLAAELVIAVISLGFPHVPQMYRQVYIAHSRDCWLPPAAEAAAIAALTRPEIDPSALQPNAACYLLAHGWNTHPPWGQAGQSKTSLLDLPPLSGAQALEITLANTAALASQTIKISLGGGPETLHVLPPGPVLLVLRLPLAGKPAGPIGIRFERQHASPGSTMAVLRLQWIKQ